MDTKTTIYIATLLLQVVCLTTASPVVCYFSSWAVYRDEGGKFDVGDIDTTLCTHFIYAFAGLDKETFELIALDPWNDFGPGGATSPDGALRRFTALKLQNPTIKTLLAVGGWGEGSLSYSQMAASADHRTTFINSILETIRDFGFDGIDIDWEYPAMRDGRPEDKVNFITFLQELKEALTPGSYMVTAAVGVTPNHVRNAYDVVNMNKYLDHIHLMAYDLHVYADGGITGHHSQMTAHPLDVDEELNLETCVDYWLAEGADPKKLFLGMAIYGKTFTLNSPKTQNGVRAPAEKAGTEGQFTKEPGFLAYYEICTFLTQTPDDWRIIRNEFYKAPYMFSTSQWVAYDDQESLQYKVDLITSRGLGGGMVWTVETDDFTGRCGETNPLVNFIHRQLSAYSP